MDERIKCRDCNKEVAEARMSAFEPYRQVCHECEKLRAAKSVTRVMDPDAWPVAGVGAWR